MANRGAVPGLASWMWLQSIATVVISVMTFAWVEYFSNVLLGQNPDYQPVLALGMIGPMAALMGTLSYVFSRRSTRYLGTIVTGIERVSQGDFETRLDLTTAGSLRDVFIKFNKMVAELAKVQTLRDDFVNSFSHEFRTPITSIQGFANLLLEEAVTEEERRRYLSIIAIESQRLAELATSTLLLAKLESQQILFETRPLALDEQLRRCLVLLSPQWQAKGLVLEPDLAEVTLPGDANLLPQVWLNLLTNAIHHTPEGGAITVALVREGSFALVRVADTGAGMDEATVAQIFQKYFQGHGAASSRGLGLGLSIAKRIVDLHQGQIRATSRVGQGTVLEVWLPLGSTS